MYKFIYWDHSERWRGVKLDEIEAPGILEAGKIFKEKTGIDPQKSGGKIQVQIERADNESRP